jgi:hypothetical protein
MSRRSSTVIDGLSCDCSSEPSFAIAFFYFDFNNKGTHPDAVLRSLIGQISVQRPCTPNALETLFSQKASIRRSPDFSELMNTLKSIIGSFHAVYIIFDALDECPERSCILSMLKEFHNWEIRSLRLLVTSRKERDIEETLGGLVSHGLSMAESLVKDDIRVHVSKTLHEDVQFNLFSEEEKQLIATTLIEGAHGM